MKLMRSAFFGRKGSDGMRKLLKMDKIGRVHHVRMVKAGGKILYFAPRLAMTPRIGRAVAPMRGGRAVKRGHRVTAMPLDKKGKIESALRKAFK